MIIEQIRYFLSGDVHEIVRLRRQIDDLRRSMGLPAGRILLADEGVDDAPAVVWQCGYEDESQMSTVEVALIGNEVYEDARTRLAAATIRVELEIYTADGSEE